MSEEQAHTEQVYREEFQVSGEALMGARDDGLDTTVCRRIAEDVAGVMALGVQVCLVIGGGNIFRGIAGAASGMDRDQADYMGMLATIMNALAMQSALEKIGVSTRVQSAIPMAAIAEPYIRRRALRHLEKGRVVIFAAGVGAPFFTTDSGAALRAAEMGCDALLKGTSVDGVYTADPKKDPSATRYDRITHDEVLGQGLAIMDTAAIALARENNIPIIVYSIQEKGGLGAILQGGGRRTVVADR